MKFVVQMASGVPDTILDVDRSTLIGNIKTKISNDQGLLAQDFKLFIFDTELEDSNTVDDVAFEDSNEVTVMFSMGERSTFVRNIGETKWLLYGSAITTNNTTTSITSFRVKPIDEREGFAITTNVFGIATNFEEVDGKKKYQALIYKANPTFMKMDSKKVELRGKGSQTTVVKIKSDGTEKELIPTNTIVFDEANNKPECEEAQNTLTVPFKTMMKKAKIALEAAAGVMEFIT